MEQQAKQQAAGPQAAEPAERLRAYLRQLSPAAQALLIREFERVAARGEDAAIATLVLKELRGLAPAPPPEPSSPPASKPESPAVAKDEARDLVALVFAPLAAFAVDSKELRPGAIPLPLQRLAWTWLVRDAMPEAAADLAESLKRAGGDESTAQAAVRQFQLAAADQFIKACSPDHPKSQRSLFRLGGVELLEMAASLGPLLSHRDDLEAFAVRLPTIIRALGPPQITSIGGILKQYPALQSPQLLPFTVALVMRRLASPWQIVRLAINAAGSDEEARIVTSPFGVCVEMVLHQLGAVAAQLQHDVRHGRFVESSHHLKTLHDAIRDLRSEIALRADSAWGRQLAALRVDISRSLKSDIESAPGRVRRLLRQRSDKDIGPASQLDGAEIEQTAALIGMVAICKPYASELAIGEMTLRALSELQQYVETATENLVAALRVSDARTQPFRRQQTDAAIRFCEIIFGYDYAALMRRAADNALTAERKPAKDE